jgi:SulP family sulfate permease
VAAITVWALVVPQAMAYAQIAGVHPQIGIFAAFAAPLGYALFGTSRQLVCGPASGTSAITAVLVAPVVAHDPAKYAPTAAALAMLCGVIFIVLGWLELGVISQFLSTPVQIGFLFGLGSTIIAGQLGHILGVERTSGPFYKQVVELVEWLDLFKGWPLAIGLVSLGALFTMSHFFPQVPAALLVVGGSLIASKVLHLSDKGVEIIGKVDRGLPTPAIPDVDIATLGDFGPGVLAIVIIGYSEAITVSRRFARQHNYDIRPDQGLTAHGAACLFGGLFHGYVAGGGASQSAANNRAGARTQVATILMSGMVLVTSLLFVPYFEDLPLTVLAAVVIHAVRGFVDVPGMKRMRFLDRQEFLMAILALTSVILLGILPGLLIPVLVSFLLMILRLVRSPVTEVVASSEGDGLVAIDSYPKGTLLPGLLVLRPDVKLSYLNASSVRDSLKQRIEAEPESPRVVMLDLEGTGALDVTTLDTLMDLVKDARDAGSERWLVNVHQALRHLLDRGGLTDAVGAEHLYRTAGDALAAYRALPPREAIAAN